MNSVISTQLPKTAASQDILSMLRGQVTGGGLTTMAQDFARALDQSQVNRQAERSVQTEPRRMEHTGNARERTSSPPQQSANTTAEASHTPVRESASDRPNRDGSTGNNESAAPETAQTADSSTTENNQAASANNEGEVSQDAGLPATLAALSSIVAALNQSDPAAGEGMDELSGVLEDLPASLKDWLTQHGAAEDSSDSAAGSDGDALLGDLQTKAEPADTSPLRGEAKLSQSAAFQQAVQQAFNGLNAASSHAGQAPAQSLQTDPSGANLAATMHGVGGNRASQSVQQLPVYTPAGQKAWTEDVGTRLIWMSNRGETKAELVLTPPSLGKLGVSLQINGDQTTAHFVASTVAARDALEQALPRLREILQQSGINLGQADVSTSSEQQQARDDSNGARGSGSRHASALDFGSTPSDGAAVSTHWHTQSSLSAVDTFA